MDCGPAARSRRPCRPACTPAAPAGAFRYRLGVGEHFLRGAARAESGHGLADMVVQCVLIDPHYDVEQLVVAARGWLEAEPPRPGWQPVCRGPPQVEPLDGTGQPSQLR